MNELSSIETGKCPVWCRAVLAAGMLLFGFYASTHMVAAGDTWVAMACGRHFANHGVDTVEPFSFNSHKAGPTEEQLAEFPEWTHGIIRKLHPTGWIDQNWLAQLIFYKLAQWTGTGGEYDYNALVYWKFALFGLTVLCVYFAGRRIGVGPLPAAAGACLSMVVGRTFFDIRPACYSNLLVPLFILILALAVYRHYKWIWMLVPVVVFWANVHGGYIYVFIMLVPFIGIHTLLLLPRRWTVCLGFIGLWLVLYLMSYKFITGYKGMIDYFYSQVQTAFSLSDSDTVRSIEAAAQKVFGYDPDTVSLLQNKMFWIWLLLAVFSLGLTSLRQVKSGVFYFLHFFAGAVYVLGLLPRFFVSAYEKLPAYFPSSATTSLLSFFFVCVLGILLILAMALKKDRFVCLSDKGLYHTMGAGAAAFAAMILLNPFHLTNLTHTFEISISKHAESWRQVNEWKPAFDWMDKTTETPNPVGNEEWFGVLCILAAVCLAAWLIGYFLKPNPNLGKKDKSRISETAEAIPWPKIDLALMIISFLTIYMAIRSRRFIAIAGGAAAPAVMLMATQAWSMITARLNWNKQKKAVPWVLPQPITHAVYAGVALVLIVLGVFWGGKFKRIYVDPWPTDNRYDSIFMRMTASHLKPYEVCDFINQNQMAGHVFNYWTEGGAVAFGQIPDPETGRTPLQLFMDGRAQAAYNHDKFRLWQTIYSGGEEGQKAARAQQKIGQLRKSGQTNTSEYKKAVEEYNTSLSNAGQWINTQLGDYAVWVILVPQSQEESMFMRAIKTTENWKTAYLDNTQHLLVDTESPKGKELAANILSGNASFPNAFSKNLTLMTVIIETKTAQRYHELYELAKQAFDVYPYPVAAIALQQLGTSSAFRDRVSVAFQDYLDDFIANENTYVNESGYFLRASSAEIAANNLAALNPEQKMKYRDLAETLRAKAREYNEGGIW